MFFSPTFWIIFVLFFKFLMERNSFFDSVLSFIIILINLFFKKFFCENYILILSNYLLFLSNYLLFYLKNFIFTNKNVFSYFEFFININ